MLRRLAPAAAIAAVAALPAAGVVTPTGPSRSGPVPLAWSAQRTAAVARGASTLGTAVATSPHGALVGLVWDRASGRVTGLSGSMAGGLRRATLLTRGRAPVIRGAVAVTDGGRAAAVWQSGARGAPPRILLADRAPDGRWTPGRPVVAAGPGAGWPQVALAPDGTLTLLYFRRSGIWSLQRAPDGTWATPQRISGAQSGNGTGPRLAAGADGGALVAWQSLGDGASLGSAYRPVGSPWGTPQPLAPDDTGYTSDPRPALDAHGHAFAVWTAGTAYDQGTGIEGTARTPAGGWGPTESVVPFSGASRARVRGIAIDPQGHVVVLAEVVGARRRDLVAAVRTGRRWARPRVLPAGPGSTVLATSALDPSTGTVAARVRLTRHRDRIVAAVRDPATDTWTPGTVATAAPGHAVSGLRVDVDTAGRAILLWADCRAAPAPSCVARTAVGGPAARPL